MTLAWLSRRILLNSILSDSSDLQRSAHRPILLCGAMYLLLHPPNSSLLLVPFPRELLIRTPRITYAGIRQSPTVVTSKESTRLNSSHLGISYAVFCLKKK